jgi:hypothetical protein
MRTLVVSTCTLIFLTSVAFSQAHEPGENANTISARQEAAAARATEAQKKQRELDTAYKAALEKTKTPVTAPADPWGGVRPANTSATNRQ